MLDIVVKYPFFKEFTEQQKIQLIKMAQYRRVTQGNALFKQDDHPDAVYLVLSGRCAVYKSQGEMRKLLAHLEVFDTVGGLYHLDERQRRAVTAEVSSESAEFVVMDRTTLDPLAAEWKAQEEWEKAAFLCEEIPVFNGVQQAVMAGLAPYFEKIQVPKDTVVYRQQVHALHMHAECGHVQVHFERSHFRAIQEEAVSIFFVWEGELQMLRRFDLQQLVSLFATQPPHSRAFSFSISSCSSPPCSCPPPPLWHLNSMCERATTSGIQLCSRMCTSYSPVLGHRVREQRHKHGNTRSPKLGGGGLKIGGDTSMQNNGGGGHAEAPPRKCSKSVPVSQSRRRRSTHSQRPGNIRTDPDGKKT